MTELTKEDLEKILEAVSKAYEQAGKKIKTATLHTEDNEELVIDNREEVDLN